MSKPNTSIIEGFANIKKLSDEVLGKPQVKDDLDFLKDDPDPHYDESRPLSGGRVKNTLSGFVEEPTCRELDEFDRGIG